MPQSVRRLRGTGAPAASAAPTRCSPSAPPLAVAPPQPALASARRRTRARRDCASDSHLRQPLGVRRIVPADDVEEARLQPPRDRASRRPRRSADRRPRAIGVGTSRRGPGEERLVRASQSCSRVMRVSCTASPSSRASCKIVSRVIPSRIELARSGVWSTPRFTMKMFSPEPSETYPFESRRIASSYPPNFASRFA